MYINKGCCCFFYPCLQAERGSVERGGLTETEPHAAAESHEQGESTRLALYKHGI